MKKVAILTGEGFEEVELSSPKESLEQANYQVDIIATKDDKVKAWAKTDWGKEYKVDFNINKDTINVNDYEALVLPGGLFNPDELRTNEKALAFIKEFNKTNKPIAAICHGSQTLINAKLVEGKNMTCYPAIKVDLENAGASYHDKAVVIDDNLITSRSPEDLEQFNQAIIDAIQ